MSLRGPQGRGNPYSFPQGTGDADSHGSASLRLGMTCSFVCGRCFSAGPSCCLPPLGRVGVRWLSGNGRVWNPPLPVAIGSGENSPSGAHAGAPLPVSFGSVRFSHTGRGTRPYENRGLTTDPVAAPYGGGAPAGGGEGRNLTTLSVTASPCQLPHRGSHVWCGRCPGHRKFLIPHS